MTEKKQLGKILLRQRALSPEQLDKALAEKKGGRLASRLTADGTISDISALKALSEQHGIPGIDLGQICLKLETLDLLPREIAERQLILPVLMREDRLFVATANPRERKVLDELEFVTGKRVYPYVALEAPLEHVIEEAYGRKGRGEAYYVGPRCPAEVLQKMGIDADGNQLDRFSLPPEPAMFGSARPLEAPGVVVDDEVEELSARDDIQEDDLDHVLPEDSVVAAVPEEPGRESIIPPLSPGARTILVVDDEADIRKMLARLLNKAGYRVIEADRGVQALRLVKEHTPDLIVLDAMLPEVHGFDIARRIKGSRRYGNIPIVMVSAVYRGWRYAENLRGSLGVDDFIEKPFTLQDVLQRIQKRLGTNGPSAPPAADTDTDMRGDVDQALQQAIEAYKAGRIDEAIEQLNRGIAIDPLAFRLRFQLGLLYGRKGQVYEAVSELETAVSVNPQHFPAVKNLAILYQKAGFRNKAVETWERALALAPDEATRLSIKDHLVRLL